MQWKNKLRVAFLLVMWFFFKTDCANGVLPAPTAKRSTVEIISEWEVFPEHNYRQQLFEKLENDSRKKMEKVGGSQGCVMFRKQRPTSADERSVRVAIKHVSNEMGMRFVIREVESLRKVKDAKIPFCVQLLSVFRGPDINAPEVFVVMNLLGFNNLEKVISNCNNVQKELPPQKLPPRNLPSHTRQNSDNNSDLMESSPAKSFTEQEICENFRRLLVALYHLHKINMIHCDIKPLNLVLDKSYRIFVTDFGLALTVDPNNLPRNYCGTRQTMAPEMYENLFGGNVPFTFSADVWSAFVVLWMWFTKDLRGPFYHHCAYENCTRKHNKEEIAEFTIEKMKRPMYMPDSIPEKAAKLIRKVLVYDQRKRPTWREIMEDEWFESNNVSFGCLDPDHKIEDHHTESEKAEPQLHRKTKKNEKMARRNTKMSGSGMRLTSPVESPIDITSPPRERPAIRSNISPTVEQPNFGFNNNVSYVPDEFASYELRDDMYDDPDELRSDEEPQSLPVRKSGIFSKIASVLSVVNLQNRHKHENSRDLSTDGIGRTLNDDGRSKSRYVEPTPTRTRSTRSGKHKPRAAPDSNSREHGSNKHGHGKDQRRRTDQGPTRGTSTRRNHSHRNYI